ncbi:Aspartate-semialdehyde dehydrogenase 2 [Serratia fonticola]|uniref:Aspartate-semialdehyde dehydrogenase 2 n=1 Tax=Serratia fonticola TaxID=47917 RepID=A0A4U9VXQ6_SERFO|nr:Aspartate-semialdehyde dehydrogenase 2 [Serratia fonticola]
MSDGWNIAVLGATGAVGEALLELLQERQFPVGELFPLASERSAGATVRFNGKSFAGGKRRRIRLVAGTTGVFCGR